MRLEAERRLLQGAVIVACMVPLLAGFAGVAEGPAMLRGGAAGSVDLDSHWRYLSGLLLGIGLAFLTCVRRIEQQGSRLRLLGAIVVVGGAARLGSLLVVGVPGLEHQIALVMELGTVPLLILWQARFAQRWRQRATGQ